MTLNSPLPLFLNEVFQRLAKVRVFKETIRTASPYVSGEGFMPAESASKMDQLLTQTEASLISAVPYQFHPDVLESILDDEDSTNPQDIALPAPITWIDNCSGSIGQSTLAGALLIDEEKRILITLIAKQAQGHEFQKRHMLSAANEFGPDAAKILSPLLNKLALLGDHKEPLIIVPDLVFDKQVRNIKYVGNGSFPFIIESADKLPLVQNYNEISRKLDRSAQEQVKQGWFHGAGHSLLLARAIVRKNPKVRIDLAPKPNTSSDSVLIKTGRAPRRTASVVVLSSSPTQKSPAIDKISSIVSTLPEPTDISSAPVSAEEPSKESALQKFDFARQIHGTDEWYIDRDRKLTPIAKLIKQKELKQLNSPNLPNSPINPFAPVFVPQDLSSPSAMEEALHAWHVRTLRYIENGFTVGMAHEQAIALLQSELHQHQERISEYVKEYRENSSEWASLTKPAPVEVRVAVVSAFQNEKFMPLPFAVLLGHFGTRFIISPDIPTYIGREFVIIGPDFFEDIKKGDLATYNCLSQQLVRSITYTLEALPMTENEILKLNDVEAPADEMQSFGLAGADQSKNSLTIHDGIAALHAKQPFGNFSAEIFQYAVPTIMATYRDFLSLTTNVAIKIRPDLNNALENSRVAFAYQENRELKGKTSDDWLSFKPIVLQVSSDYGVPPELTVNALKLAYESASVSTKRIYSLQPIAFVLAGPEKPECANELGFITNKATLLVGSDYLDPAKIRRWFTGVPLKPGQAVTIENLSEEEIRTAASNGILKGALYALRSLNSGRGPDVNTKFEGEIKGRLPNHYVNEATKQIIVASIIGEICAYDEDNKLNKKFPQCTKFCREIYKDGYYWERDLVPEHEHVMFPGSSSFTINRVPGVLTTPQVRLFETINTLMSEMHITPEEMDAGFQFEAFRLTNWFNIKTNEYNLQKYEEMKSAGLNPDEAILGNAGDKSEAVVRSEAEALARPFDHENSNTARPEFNKRSPKSQQEFRAAARDYSDAIKQLLWDKSLALPPYATSKQRKAYDKYLTVKAAEETQEEDVQAHNILQTYASGHNLLEMINRDDLAAVPKAISRRPSLDKLFELAILGAVDEFINHKYPESPPDSVQQLRSELQGSFSVPAIANNRQGLVFLGSEELSLIEKRNEIDQFKQLMDAMNALGKTSEEAVQATPQDAQSQLDGNKPEDKNTQKEQSKEDAVSVISPLNGSVVQRIFREAGKFHPNNSPERNDDITRMQWLAEKLRKIGELII